MPVRDLLRTLALTLGLACALAGSSGAAPSTAQRWSQLTHVGFEHLPSNAGVPSDIATSVAEDGQGFIWIGSLGGLARWDGYRARLYRSAPGTAGALPDNVVQTLHGDRAGRLWIGTSAAGLVRHDPATDRFVAYAAGPQGLSHVSVRALTDDARGQLWIGTDAGLDQLDPVSGRIQRWAVDGRQGLAGGRVNALLHDRQGCLWAGTPAGLFRLDPGAERFVQVPVAAGVPLEVAHLAEDSLGQRWIGSLRHGAFVIDPRGGAAQPVRDTLATSAGDSLELQAISGIVESRPGEVWLATAAQGIVAVDTGTRQTRRIRNVPSLPMTLPDNAVRSLHRDRSGLVWVVTERGVSHHDPRQSAVLTMYGAPPVANAPAPAAGPVRTEVSWILPTAPDRIWLGTHLDGIHVIDPSGARVASLTPDASRPDSALPQDNVLAMVQAPDRSVYIGTKRGLYRASEDGRRVARVRIGSRDPGASTWALHLDGSTLWIGGQIDGLWRLDLRSGQGGPLAPTLARQLSDQRIVVLAGGGPGRLWVGTRFGLNRLDHASGTVLPLRPEPSRNDGLRAGFVTALHLDRQQRLWVGTYGGGIGLIDAPGSGAALRLRPLSVEQGLPDNNVNALIEDSGGAVWVSTDNGLARVDPATLAVKALQRAEGVAFPTYWTGSAARTGEGELLFGGAGMTIVKPQHLQGWNYRPPVVVTDLRVGTRAQPAGAPSLAEGPLPAVKVPADGNSLMVEFSALDFSAPARNRYAYRLEGFDADWIATDASRRLAAYTNLPPGEYRLRLRGSNREGTWTGHELQLPVQVLPAWHQTLAFRLGAALAGLLAVAVLVQSRTRLLRARQAELERKVQERTAELEAMSRALTEKSRVLEQSSLSDPLTGLRNRRLLTEQIDALVAASQRRARSAAPGADPGAALDSDNLFLLVDVDHFKRVNDRLGHAAGDAVLVQVGQRLRAALRETDLLVRWGGEEFLVVAHDRDRAQAGELADHLRHAMEARPFVLDDGQPLTIRCSVGWACMPFLPGAPDEVSWPEVVKLADLALLAAKRGGRNTCIGLVAGERARPQRLVARVQADPRAAVEQGDIEVHSGLDAAAVLAALSPRGPVAEGE